MAIHVGRSPDLMDMLFAGELDLTISTRKADGYPNLVLRSSPVVWIAASDYQLVSDEPLSLVLADEPSIFPAIALEALTREQWDYKESYIAPNLAGIKAAVRAGLGITARSIEMVTPEFRVLGEHQRLPSLPTINFYLYLQNDSPSEAAKNFISCSRARLEAPHHRWIAVSCHGARGSVYMALDHLNSAFNADRLQTALCILANLPEY